MRFMVMHKVDGKMEAGQRPDPSIIQNMGALIGRHLKDGTFKDGAGLHRSAERARITFAGATPTVTRGPYAGSNELVATFVLVTTTGIEQAIELGTELGRAAGNREVEVGLVVEGWDLTGKPRPADAPWRYLLLVKADAATEAGTPLPAAVATLVDRWTKAGIAQSQTTLAPSKGALRYKAEGGKRSWIDGPFAESKELIAGFSVLEVPSLEAAKAFTIEYANILGDNEVDIREVV